MHVRIPARQLEILSCHFLGIQMQGRFEDHGLGYLRTLSLVILLCITRIQVNHSVSPGYRLKETDGIPAAVIPLKKPVALCSTVNE